MIHSHSYQKIASKYLCSTGKRSIEIMKSTKNLPELFEKLIQFQLAMLQLSFYYGGDNYLGCWLK